MRFHTFFFFFLKEYINLGCLRLRQFVRIPSWFLTETPSLNKGLHQGLTFLLGFLSTDQFFITSKKINGERTNEADPLRLSLFSPSPSMAPALFIFSSRCSGISPGHFAFQFWFLFYSTTSASDSTILVPSVNTIAFGSLGILPELHSCTLYWCDFFFVRSLNWFVHSDKMLNFDVSSRFYLHVEIRQLRWWAEVRWMSLKELL